MTCCDTRALWQFGDLPKLVSKDEMAPIIGAITDTLMGDVEGVPGERIQKVGNDLNNFLQGRMAGLVDAAKAEGQAALAAAAAEEGATQTASGLVYQEIKHGIGPKPTDGSTVQVRGTRLARRRVVGGREPGSRRASGARRRTGEDWCVTTGGRGDWVASREVSEGAAIARRTLRRPGEGGVAGRELGLSPRGERGVGLDAPAAAGASVMARCDDDRAPYPQVHYHGTLIDGTVFDSSKARGEPAQFALKQVIAGWTEGLQLMGEGGVAKLTIPSDLAYGDGGQGATIPAGATLVFEVGPTHTNTHKHAHTPPRSRRRRLLVFFVVGSRARRDRRARRGVHWGCRSPRRSRLAALASPRAAPAARCARGRRRRTASARPS